MNTKYSCKWKDRVPKRPIQTVQTQIRSRQTVQSADPVQIWSDWVFPVCYSDKHFLNASPDNQHLYENSKAK